MKTQTEDLKSENIYSEELIEGFIRDCKLRNFSDGTITCYRLILKRVSNFLSRDRLPLVKLDKYTLKKLLKFLVNDRGLSVKTLENYFSALSSFYDYLAYEELTDRNPILPFRKRYLRHYKTDGHNPKSSRKLISIEQMRMLINSILDPRDKAILALLAKTGIRRKELINIDLDDINWEEQSKKMGKSKSEN